MRLQIALDIPDLAYAMTLAEQVHDLVDIIELGTPLLIREGVRAIEAMRRRFPEAVLLADLKIADGGFLESRMAVEAGANIVTVLGIAEDDTILGVCRATHQAGRQTYVDMLAVTALAARAEEIDSMGADIIGVHTAFDVQHSGRTPFEELSLLKQHVRHAQAAAAGGINEASIGQALALGAEIAVVGSALTGATDIRETAARLRQYCRR